MRFKTLEIEGFKSFPDKTVLHFDQRTTAVVGSNGNGKSNISDALRWVMGEQSSKTLRGSNMEDVIFYGTKSRKPMGVAKVALTIENGDRTLPIDETEVVITRKLYRSGDSEYLINGKKTRLKDIGALFMGTGLGRDGYSIIGQGRIEEIVNSKAEQRRELFEEAAGVSKFLHQKTQAERELTKTQENLLRLLDIETELQTRLPVLEKQAEKAKRAFELKKEEEGLSVALSVFEIERISKEIEEVENTILLNMGECEHYEREITELEQKSDGVAEQKRGLAAQTDRLRRESETAKDDIAETDKAIAVMENEIVHNDGRICEINKQIELSEKSGETILSQIDALKEQIVSINDSIAKCKTSMEEQRQAAEELDGRNASLDEEHRAIAETTGKLYTAKSAAEIYISRAGENIVDLTSQLENAKLIINGQADEKTRLRSQYDGLKKQLEEAAEEKEENANKLSGFSRLYEGKETKREEARSLLDDIKIELQQKKTRFDILNDVERSMTGFHTSVKAVLLAAKAGQYGNNAVFGTVADVIKVDGRYSTAVEIALGAALQNIIVSNETTAKRCIAFLKEKKAGRATFLPLTSVKGRTLQYDNESLYDEDGFVGFGHEICEYDAKFAEIIKSLLGRTVFVEDIDVATVMAKKYGYKFRIVTLDGQVINAGGSFTGGSVKKSEGIIGRKQEIEDLQKQLNALNEKLEPAKANYERLAAECAKMKLECEGFRENLTKINGDEARLNAELNGVNEMLQSFDEQLCVSQATLERCENRIDEENGIIEFNKKELLRIEAELSAKEKSAGEKGKLLEEVIRQRKEIAEAISELNRTELSYTKDIESLNSQIAHLDKTRLEAGGTRDNLLNEIAEYEKKNDELKEQIEQNRQSINEIKQSYNDNRAEISLLITKTEEHEKQITEIIASIRDKTEDKAKFSNAYAVAVERKTGLERKSEDIKAKLFDEYELTPSEAKTAFESQTTEFDDSAEGIKKAKAALNDIKRKLSSLGAVNYAAIDEFTEVSERYAVLSEQLSDVRKAKSELEKMIADLITDIRQRFLESFNEINHHFSRIFTEIFGGGEARLELTDADDVLNAGIEFYVAPPGKVTQKLMLLSGGEKALVAITLYFAILLHRPSPFCMLDEVDAALDEVNVSKYINYIKRYSDTTQLMMITHRRPTIEGCDVLYGVYMQEKGVSRLLKHEVVSEVEL